jgi:2,4-dienoyl-CoA reductase-like NADH-dependent reductase (Old Yellow Enzyme family)
MAPNYTFKTIDDLKSAIAAFAPSVPFTDSVEVSTFRTPLTVEGFTIPNRLCAHPMEGRDAAPDGGPGELTTRKYTRIAAGGTGMIWVEATAVTPESRSHPRQLWIHHGNRDAFKQLVDDIRRHARDWLGQPIRPLILLQLTHSGRYSKPDGVPAPITAYRSPVLDPSGKLADCPLATDDYIDDLMDKFVAAARIARECGFDGVDVKACHGYFLHELLSAYTRTASRYGGSFENRSRLFLETVRRVKAAVGDHFIVTTRVNVYDAYPHPYGFGMKPGGGLDDDMSEPEQLLQQLQDSGVTMASIAFGNPYYNPHIERPYEKPVAGGQPPEENPLVAIERLIRITAGLSRKFPRLATVSVGFSWLRQFYAHVAAAMLEQQMCSVVGVGRLSLAYPDYANDLLGRGFVDPRQVCTACSCCSQIMRDGGKAGCVVRDANIYMPIYREGRSK